MKLVSSSAYAFAKETLFTFFHLPGHLTLKANSAGVKNNARLSRGKMKLSLGMYPAEAVKEGGRSVSRQTQNEGGGAIQVIGKFYPTMLGTHISLFFFNSKLKIHTCGPMAGRLI